MELVEIDDKLFILKTIHRDFAEEIIRQQAISKIASDFKVPHVLDKTEESGGVQFLMEYFAPTRTATDRETVELLEKLHTSLNSIEDRSIFPTYTVDQLKIDLVTFNRYAENYGSSISLNSRDFQILFNEVGIIHGDWAKDQIIISNDDKVIIDFGNSMIAPLILDYAHAEIEGIKTGAKVTSIAKTLVYVMRVAWFDRCKREYIDYSYKAEIQGCISMVEKLA